MATRCCSRESSGGGQARAAADPAQHFRDIGADEASGGPGAAAGDVVEDGELGSSEILEDMPMRRRWGSARGGRGVRASTSTRAVGRRRGASGAARRICRPGGASSQVKTGGSRVTSASAPRQSRACGPCRDSAATPRSGPWACLPPQRPAPRAMRGERDRGFGVRARYGTGGASCVCEMRIACPGCAEYEVPDALWRRARMLRCARCATQFRRRCRRCAV